MLGSGRRSSATLWPTTFPRGTSSARMRFYLPQSKVYNACCALGPVIVTADELKDPYNLTLTCTITRGGKTIFQGRRIHRSRLHRKLETLVEYLLRANPVPAASVLLTGTGIIVKEEAALAPGESCRSAFPKSARCPTPPHWSRRGRTHARPARSWWRVAVEFVTISQTASSGAAHLEIAQTEPRPKGAVVTFRLRQATSFAVPLANSSRPHRARRSARPAAAETWWRRLPARRPG